MTVTSSPYSAELQHRLQSEQGNIIRVKQAMVKELARFGLEGLQTAIDKPFSMVTLRKDPFDGAETLLGEWRDKHGQLIGNMQVMANGQAFAEFDVVAPHPSDSRWFVEAVTAWGPIAALKTELRLLPATGSNH